MEKVKKIGTFSFVDTAQGTYALNMSIRDDMTTFFNVLPAIGTEIR